MESKVILGSPVVVQSIFIHSVDLPSWLMRLFVPWPALLVPFCALLAMGAGAHRGHLCSGWCSRRFGRSGSLDENVSETQQAFENAA